MEPVLVIDQGTTGTRAAVYVGGRRVAYSYLEHRQIYPRPGWVEHDPEEIARNALRTAREALEKAGVEPSRLAAVGVTNQRETVVAWDRVSGRPLYNAIVWQDTRTQPIVDELVERGLRDAIAETTGLTPSTYFSATKIAWLLRQPRVAEAAARGRLAVGTVDSWLIWVLTGGEAHVTDVTNASRTMLFDIHRLEWSDELLRALGIPLDALPEVRPSVPAEPYGHARGLGGAPVYAALGDQQAALFGQAAYRRGGAKNTYGTGCFLLVNTGGEPPRPGPLLATIAYQVEGQPPVYALEGSVAVAGAAIKWLRDSLRLFESARELDRLAEEAYRSGEHSLGAYFVPAFSGLYAPYWDPTARGALLGLTAAVQRRHIAYATLEAIAQRTTDVLEAAAQAGVNVGELRVDGGAAKSDILLQIQADVAGIPVLRPSDTETTSLGAALAAGLAAGLWRSLDELEKLWRLDARFTPNTSLEERAKAREAWRRALEKARGWLPGAGKR